jgi:hypothetical protein
LDAIFWACGPAQAAPVTSVLIINHFIFFESSGFKLTAVNAEAAMGTGFRGIDGQVIRFDGDIILPVSQEELQIMAAAGAATAQGEQLVIRHIEAQMDQPVLIGLDDNLKGFLQSDLPGIPVGDPLPAHSIQDKTDLQRLVAPVVFQPADTFGQSYQFGPSEDFLNLVRRQNVLHLFK